MKDLKMVIRMRKITEWSYNAAHAALKEVSFSAADSLSAVFLSPSEWQKEEDYTVTPTMSEEMMTTSMRGGYGERYVGRMNRNTLYITGKGRINISRTMGSGILYGVCEYREEVYVFILYYKGSTVVENMRAHGGWQKAILPDGTRLVDLLEPSYEFHRAVQDWAGAAGIPVFEGGVGDCSFKRRKVLETIETPILGSTLQACTVQEIVEYYPCERVFTKVANIGDYVNYK